MSAGFRLNQLRRDPDPRVYFAHRAFEHVAHTELLPDLFHIDRFSLVSEAGVSSDDEQPADAGERGGDLLDHAIREVFLVEIATEILKRHHGNRGLVG